MVEYLIVFYILFCLTTVITAMWTILRPVINILTVEDPENIVLQSKSMGYFVFFCIGLLTAPLLFIATIIPKYNLDFQDVLVKSLCEEE